MKAVSVKNPWASAAVFGGLEVLNLGFTTRYRGPILIHAGGSDPRGNSSEVRKRLDVGHLADQRNAFIGLVTVSGAGSAADCQLPWGFGPQVWTFDEPLVFPEPVPWPKFKGIDWITDAEVMAAAKNALGPREWHAAFGPPRSIPTADEVYPPRRDGWAGD